MIVRECANPGDLSSEIKLFSAFREACLGMLTVGNILNYGDEIVDAAVRAPHATDGETCPDDATILADIALLDAVAIGFADECLVEHREIGRKIVWVCEVSEGLRLEFLDGITKHPGEAVVGAQNCAVATHHRNAHRRIFERSSEAGLAIDKRAPCLDLLRSLLREQKRAANPPIRPAPGDHGPAHPVGAAVLARELVFSLRQLLTG